MGFDYVEKEEKAAYNQSRNITEILGNLLGSYVYYMSNGDLPKAVKSICRIHDIIAAKIKPEESKDVDRLVYSIQKVMPLAMQTYTAENGTIFFVNERLRNGVEYEVVKLFRIINKLQDKYGYGMVSLDDPRFAVLQR